MGCMRVFITPVCNSVVMRLRRWVALMKASGRDVVQYRDSVLPLIDVCGTLGYTPDFERDASQLPVVVYSAGRR